jgi:hypothetical protein
VFRLLSIAIVLVTAMLGTTLINTSSDAKPINTWGAICATQRDHLECCIRMLNACRQGCFVNGNCLRDACEGHYNRCLQRRVRNSSTGVRPTGPRPPASTSGQ